METIIKNKIHFKFPYKYLLYITNTNKLCGILMGITGSGKTTLLNMLCGTNHKSGAGMESVTRALYLNPVNCGEKPFDLIDTPGTDSQTESYKHAVLLRYALTTKPLNAIFFIIKYDNRYERMIEVFEKLQQLIYKYEEKIVVLISHWDMSKDQEKEFPIIYKAFEDYCSYMICYSEKSSNIELVNLLYNSMCDKKPEVLIIPDEQFFLEYNIIDIKGKIKKSFNEYKISTKKLTSEFDELINLAIKNEDADEILHMLIVEYKSEVGNMLKEFENKHGGDMIGIDLYTMQIKMQKENLVLCDLFSAKVSSLMSYDLFDKKDPRNLIKKCPQCGIVWIKVEGCDGITNCGNKTSTIGDYFGKIFCKFNLKRINGKLKWEKNSVQQGIDIKVRKNSFEKNNPSKRIGCGASFNWSNLPKLDDLIILELFKVKSVDEAKIIINDLNFVETRKLYEKNIDKNFHYI